MDLVIELKTVPEPLELKEQILSTRDHFRSNLKTPDIDVDSMAVWFRNDIPKYIWNEWKISLKGLGITWPKFLKLLKYNTKFMIGWMNGKIDWVVLNQNIRKSIEDSLDPQIEKMAEAYHNDCMNASLGRENKSWAELNENEKMSRREQAAKILQKMGLSK